MLQISTPPVPLGDDVHLIRVSEFMQNIINAVRTGAMACSLLGDLGCRLDFHGLSHIRGLSIAFLRPCL